MKLRNDPNEQTLRLADIDFERPRLDDSLYKENPQPHGFGMNPSDGLPAPSVTNTFEDTEAADLTPERFVCMADPATGREQCAHYKRQLLPSSMSKDVRVCLRYCTALRNEQGEMVDLGNTEVLACEFRQPYDVSSSRLLDQFDDEVMRRQEERRGTAEVFDPVKALGEQDD